MIRKYLPEDCKHVISVWAEASEIAHPFLDKEFLESEREQIRTTHLPNAETWIWEVDDVVLGFISLIGNEVGAVFVRPSAHRSGVGRALMDHARALHGELEVEVFAQNSIGRAFYEKYGFEFMRKEIHEATGLSVLRLRLAASNSAQPTAPGCG